MHFRRIKENKGEYMDLLLLADESELMIAKYLERGEMYILEDFAAKLADVAVIDRQPKAEGRSLVLILGPKKS